MNPVLIRKRQIAGELTLRAQRPCSLMWNDGQAKEVLGREGFATFENEGLEGGFVDRKHCKFFVFRDLIPAAVRIDTVFGLKDRDDKWRLKKIHSGLCPHDLLWIFECVEEDS